MTVKDARRERRRLLNKIWTASWSIEVEDTGSLASPVASPEEAVAQIATALTTPEFQSSLATYVSPDLSVDADSLSVVATVSGDTGGPVDDDKAGVLIGVAAGGVALVVAVSAFFFRRSLQRRQASLQRREATLKKYAAGDEEKGKSAEKEAGVEFTPVQ